MLEMNDMQKTKQLKVVFDTNVWIHFLWSNKFSVLDKYIYNKTLQLIYSDETITELLEVLQRPKFQNRITQNQINELILLFEVYGQKYHIASKIDVCRDESGLKKSFSHELHEFH